MTNKVMGTVMSFVCILQISFLDIERILPLANIRNRKINVMLPIKEITTVNPV